ncbi:hypothetical protein ACH4FX_12180 [Streptomyces sp. NPDC018019]|uniref:hypothetical protein n=1 Tax=Streptomyces sp. NPDC018019 TaxID=3365030 RepID=UPI00379EF833
MRLTVKSAGRRVEIRISGDSPGLLAAAEASAQRLLDALPPETGRPPFGYAVSSETERAENEDDES